MRSQRWAISLVETVIRKGALFSEKGFYLSINSLDLNKAVTKMMSVFRYDSVKV